MKDLTIKDVFFGSEELEVIESQDTIMRELEADIKLRAGYSFKALMLKDEVVGYAVYNDVSEVNLLSVLDDIYVSDNATKYEEELREDFNNGIYLAFFEIFEEHQNKGFGTYMFDELFGDEDMLLYSLADSTDFWDSLGFEEFNGEAYYLVRQTRMVA